MQSFPVVPIMSFIVGFFFFNSFIFWLRWVFIAVHGLSLVAVSGGYSLLQCASFSLQWLLLLHSTGSRCTGFSSCGTRAQQLWLTGSRAQARQLWHTGLVAPQHVGSSRTRAQTHVPRIGRQILNHCAPREVPIVVFLINHCILHIVVRSLSFPLIRTVPTTFGVLCDIDICEESRPVDLQNNPWF